MCFGGSKIALRYEDLGMSMIDKKDHGYQLHETTPDYLDLVRSHKEPYIFKLNGEDILILPGVMSPKYDWAGHYMIENLPDVKDKDVLEIGCGCGLVSMAAFRAGAEKVVAVDINLAAIDNTNQNFIRIGTNDKCVAKYSDVFKNVDGLFDVVIFNAPYHACKANDDLEKGVADENYKALRDFFLDVASFLKNDGVVAVGFSSSGDHVLFDKLSQSSGLELTNSVSDIRQGYQCEIHTYRKA